MRNILHCLTALVVCASLVTRVHGQDSSQPLTESAAVQLALRHQPALRVAQTQAEMAEARVGQARAAEALQISANGLAAASSLQNVLAAPDMLPQALLQTQSRSSVDVNGMAMLPLFTGGRLRSSIRSAQYSASAAQYQLATARTQIAFDARTRFAQWEERTALLAVTGDTLAAQTKNTTVTQQLFDAGKVPQFDLLRAQAAQAAAEQQVANARAEVIASRAQLAQALGVPAETLPDTAAEPLTAAPPLHALDTALLRRPDLLAAQQSIYAARATLAARKAEYRPQIYGVGMVDVLAPAEMGKSAGVTVGVIAGVPILDGGRRKSEVCEAEQGVQQANAELAVLELQVRAEVAAAEARVTAARQNIDTASSQVTAADAAYTVAQARYSGGKSTIVELLDVQRALTDARQSQVIARAQYRAMLATLFQAMGVDIVE